MQLVTITEGRCVQAMHTGPYAEEPKTLAAMDELKTAAGLEANGLHHETDLTDVATTELAKPRTILRQPVRPR